MVHTYNVCISNKHYLANPCKYTTYGISIYGHVVGCARDQNVSLHNHGLGCPALQAGLVCSC